MVSLKSNGGRQSTVIHAAVLMSVFLFGSRTVLAQVLTLDVSQYLHSSWTAQDGYFRGLGGAMAQTADGYIWVLSVNGLLRFDGVRFVEWTPPNGEPLPGKPPSALLASGNGSLWLAGHGVAELRSDGTWHRYRELDSSSLVTLAKDKDGVIWAGVGGRPTSDSCSLFRIEHGKAECYKRPELTGMNVSCLYVDGQGTLWAGVEIGILRVLPGTPKLVQKTRARVGAFSEDSQGALLYTSNGPIWKLSADSGAQIYLEKVAGDPINARAISKDGEGSLWIGTSGEGVVHLHEGRADHFTSSDGLSSNFVQSIFHDREGNVWATSPDGIDKFTKPAVSTLTRKQGLSTDSVLSVLTDRSGRTWVGTDNGLNELVGDHLTKPSLKFRSHPGLALVETRAGRVSIATLDRRKAAVRNDWRRIPDGSDLTWLEGQIAVYAVAEDKDGTLWAASNDRGLLHLRADGGVIRTFNGHKFGDYPLSVAFDPKRDGIWFTTHQGELFLLKDDQISEHYGLTDGLGYGPTRIIHVDTDGGVWIATKQGLAHLVDGKVSVLGRNNGLPCDAVHWMQRDEDHTVWLLAECGLLGFSESGLQAWIARPSHVLTLSHLLDNTEGVENRPGAGWFAPLTATTKDGRIVFAMRTGLGVLDPRHLNRNPLPPPVHIEAVTVDGRAVGNTGRVSLPSRTAAIHIAYTALSFAAPRKVQFRYKLQGYDKDWSSPVSLREVAYTNLPPGNYSFGVIACNNNDVWNEHGATFEFTIQPAFYQTRSFLLLCAMALSGVVWLGLQWRIKRVAATVRERAEVRADERVRIARDLHDTLLQGVQGLMLHFHVAAQELPEGSRTRASMERALATADRIVVEGRNRVTRLRVDDFTPADLADAFAAVAADLNHEQRGRFALSITGRAEALTSPVLHELYYIGREAISNAFRHANASEIAVTLHGGPKAVVLAVTDNGCGFDSAVLEARPRTGHWGLQGMKERAEAVGARFECQSAEDKGTTVIVSVPGRRAYGKRRAPGLVKRAALF